MVTSSDDQTTTMVYQVNFTESRPVFRPVRPGANRDPILEQGARLGEPTSLARPTLTTSPQSVHRGWADHEELLVALAADWEITSFEQSWHLPIHGCSKSGRADVVE